MGYESKVYIVQEWESCVPDRKAYGDLIAVFDLSKMGYEIHNKKSFRDLFYLDRTCDIYSVDGRVNVPEECWKCKIKEKESEIITEDCYGDPIEKADNAELIAWLEESLKKDYYWRAEALLECLKTLYARGIDFSVYHFGY